jgi:hypothetical protein
VSSRHTRSLFGVMLAVVFALSAVVVAPASAKLTKSQKVHIRHQLRKAIKKNPKLIRSKSFIKRASLVNFKLPVTIRLRGGNTAGTNVANIDLGASLGQRTVSLGGSLAAEIVFHDSYDGGALGNVDLSINPSSKNLTSTSIPLLWNQQVSTGRADANALGLGAAASGCGDFHGTSNIGLGAGILSATGTPQPGGPGLPGYPVVDPAVNPAAPSLFLPVVPGQDDPTNVVAGYTPGNDYVVGGNPDPFPYAVAQDPTADGVSGPPSTADTVLRTNALKLGIATPGTPVNGATNADGLSGSQNSVIGKSGGQANLFGHIPGKSDGIDVTVNLATRINSILRVVDQDSFGSPLISGNNYPAGIFNCRQIWTGGIDNYIQSVHLTGNLKIAPGITSDGHLRIAKATIATPSGDSTRFGVAACLAPYSGVDAQQHASDADPFTDPLSKLPSVALNGGGGLVLAANLPADTGTSRPAPSVDCNAPPTGLVAHSALGAATVSQLAPTVPGNGYTTTASGSAVSVAADLNVQNVSVDVLIGDTP